MTGEGRVEPLSDLIDRSDFSCGVDALDRYLQTQAGQDIRRNVATCFVFLLPSPVVRGFYTLSATAIELTDLPPALARRLPRYGLVPAVRLGRLAVDVRMQGRGLGAALLADAFQRVARSDVACWAMVVDAKDDAAAVFYSRFGFRPLGANPLQLFLPMAEARAVIAASMQDD